MIVPATDRPETLDRCREAIEAAADAPEEVVVVETPVGATPAEARNTGALLTSADVLVFLDADVLVALDVFTRIRAAFASDPSLTGLFGSYDDAPTDATTVSRFRNLLTHHVHQSGAGPATTFWSGLGAIRRRRFMAVDGFDPRRRYLEDIELGMRLAEAGDRVRLDPGLLCKHLKVWTLPGMVRTDLLRRGAPWTGLLFERRCSSTALNLAWRHRVSAAASVLVLGAVGARRPLPGGAAVVAIAVLNRRFYRLLWARGGPRLALPGLGLHLVHHLTSVAAIPVGIATVALSAGRPAPGRGPAVAVSGPAAGPRRDIAQPRSGRRPTSLRA